MNADDEGQQLEHLESIDASADFSMFRGRSGAALCCDDAEKLEMAASNADMAAPKPYIIVSCGP
jgi:hypothetical protein